MLNKLILLLVAAAWFIFPNGALALQNSVPGELVVKLRDEPSANKSHELFAQIANSLRGSLHSKAAIKVKPLQTTDRYAVFKLNAADLDNAKSILNHHALVAYAEPNFIYHTFVHSEISLSDPEFSKLWGLKNTGQTDPVPAGGDSEGNVGQVGTPNADIHVAKLWQQGIIGSKKIKVAVIDTGINYLHPDLADNIWTSPVDGSHGWNFVNNTNDPMDDANHGSHCAGTIGAVANNGIGVVGVNWQVSMVPIKFLNEEGAGALSGAIDAIHFAVKSEVQIMSNSWGGGNFSQALYDSINEARTKGILFVAAAGNNGSDNDAYLSYPASYDLDNIIAVAATDNQDHLASFSNYGKTKVHVAAPGVKILSTLKNGGYGLMSGTSMATPHVAGIAALMLSVNPSLSYSQIKSTLIKTSDKSRNLEHRVVAQGRVNAYNAIHGIESAPLPQPGGNWREVPLSIESAHPYEERTNVVFPVKVPGAKFIKIVFDKIDTEALYDQLFIESPIGNMQEAISGQKENYVTDSLEGDSAIIRFISDETNNGYGFKVSKVLVSD